MFVLLRDVMSMEGERGRGLGLLSIAANGVALSAQDGFKC